MRTATKLALVGLAGVLGIVMGCPLTLPPIPRQCWCGEEWRAQISGATAYSVAGNTSTIPASDTSHTRCMTMLEHIALDAANPEDPVYVALRDSLESQAIASCELAGAALLLDDFHHTDCATTGIDPVTTNIVRIGVCWEWEDVEAKPYQLCPLESTCGQFYDCSDEPIMATYGVVEGETDGVPWYSEEVLWSCDDPAGNIDGPSEIRF
jgi:hypothetical protein